MRGHIRKRGSTYSIVVDIGRDENGKRKQKWYSGYKTKKEAEKALADIIAKIEKGEYFEPEKITLANYLNYWLETYALPNVAPTTYASYKQGAEVIARYIGKISLDQLKPIHVQNFISKLQTETQLSSTSIHQYYGTLNTALNYAIRLQMLRYNPCKAVTPPPKNKNKMKVLSQAEVSKLIEGCKDTPLYLPILLAITCGMRRGEILGLKWDNVDLQAKQIHIEDNLTQADGKPFMTDPKTTTGKRSVSVPDITISALKETKKMQAQQKLMLGSQYKDNGFVCCWDNGEPFRPDYITHAFKKILAKLKLPNVRFHDLRHTHATLLLAQGVHPKVVQERLGHSSITITLDTYSHLVPNLQQEAAQKINDMLSMQTFC